MNSSTTIQIIRIVIWAVIGASAVFFLIQITSGRWSVGDLFSLGRVPEHVIRQETLDGDIRDVAIQWTAGGLVIRPGDVDRITLTEKAVKEGADSLLQFNVDGDALTVSSKKTTGFTFLFWGTRHTQLEVLLPRVMYNEIAIESTSGTSDVSGLDVESLIVKMTSGLLNIENVDVEAADISMTSGSMKGQKIRIETLRFRMTSGKVEMSGRFPSLEMKMTSGSSHVVNELLPEHLRGDMTSGRMTFTLPENNGFTVRVDKTSGRFSSDFPLTSAGDLHTYKEGGPDFQLSCDSGIMKLLRAEQ